MTMPSQKNKEKARIAFELCQHMAGSIMLPCKMCFAHALQEAEVEGARRMREAAADEIASRQSILSGDREYAVALIRALKPEEVVTHES